MADYSWIAKEPAPKMLVEANKLIGTYEFSGDANNPTILQWAKDLNIKDYKHDSIPWCGLFMAHVASKAGKPVVASPLWALSWAKWGNACEPELGCVMTFKRDGGGHVGLYVGEDDTAYHILGGNQSDKVCVTRIPKSRFYAARNLYNNKPTNVRKIILAADGKLSTNEA